MFQKSTFVVVGAGASNEASLPTGSELKARIASLLDIRFDWNQQKQGDYLIADALRIAATSETQKLESINPYLHEAWHVRDAIPQALSIDNFLDSQQGNARLARCGKLAIVRAILEGERQSSLFVDPLGRDKHPSYSSLEGTWYDAFFKLLTEGCRVGDVANRLASMTLVVFNYDRCVEHFLHLALQNYYRIGPENATEIMSNLSIFHPYGAVGTLPWQSKGKSIGFGDEPSPRALFDLSSEIKTFTEATDPDASEIKEIRARLLSARIVLFLGFAFHKQNIELLRSAGGSHAEAHQVRYFGTALGLSRSDCDVVGNDLANLAGASPARIALRNDLKCAPFFFEYWRSLSLS